MLVKSIPEVAHLQVASNVAELEDDNSSYSLLIIYQNDGNTLSRLVPHLHDFQALLLVCDQYQSSGRDIRDVAPVWGLVSTGISPEALRTAILALTQQLIVVEASFSDHADLNLSNGIQSDESYEALTERELTVLRKIAEGLTNKMIAQELGISENTVKFHISALFSKINASSRTDAVRRGARLGLLAL
jgi:DNA-binding NarL/FixJ family response regulator